MLADEIPLPIDANVITAIDVSGSIAPQDEALQFDGIVKAIVDPDFLQTVARGLPPPDRLRGLHVVAARATSLRTVPLCLLIRIGRSNGGRDRHTAAA